MVPGPTGPQGPQGLIGVPGAVGSVGPAGPQGEAGLSGAPGSPGAVGPKGDQGVQGPKGEKGIKGDNGVPGGGNVLYVGKFTDGGSFPQSSLLNAKSMRVELILEQLNEGTEELMQIAVASTTKDISSELHGLDQLVDVTYFDFLDPSTKKIHAYVSNSASSGVASDIIINRVGFATSNFYLKVFVIY